MLIDDITFVKLSVRDVDELISISITSFSDAFASQNTKENFDYYLKNSFNKETITSQLLNPHTEFYFAMKHHKIVGYLKLNFDDAQTDVNDDHALELERIYVLKDYQGKGYGKRFLDFVIKLANQKVKNSIWLGVWNKNVRAIAFYETLGFKIFGSHPFAMGSEIQTDYLMKLELI